MLLIDQIRTQYCTFWFSNEKVVEYEKINEKEEENRKKDVARWIVVCVLNYSYNKGDLMFGESGNHGNIQKIGMWNICAESSAIEFPYP